MTRTKRPVHKKEKHSEDDDAFKKLDRLGAEWKKKIELRGQMQCADIELAFKILLESISPDILQKTVGELKSELVLKEVQQMGRKTRNSSNSASQDDGYMTENSSQGSGQRGKKRMAPPSTVGRSAGRRSRSADASARKQPATARKTAQRRRSQSTVYRTPAYNKNAAVNYPDITPKVVPHTPMTVLRQPRAGEMVVSMSGSPVMVPSYNNMQRNDKANCNIMLDDGTVLSLQPQHLRQSQAYIPFSLMSQGVLSQLKTLKDNLGMVVKLGEQACRE